MTILPQNKSSDFTVEKLLQHKMLEPLPQEKVNELQRLERFDVSGFTEADIREVIIAPLLRVLGYEKNSYFSIDHEKAIRIRGRSKFLDYGVSLFSENFWVIEAKKPKNSRKNFGPNDILQGLGYAAHPDINAALIVFCDGRILEIFDREANLETPIISAAICNLSQHINDIRALLGPWQYWFYQRRRVVRLAEKVIASETSLERANELVEQIQTIIHEKRSSILKNYRARTNFSEERGKWIEYLREADPREIIDVWFFRRHASLGELNAMAENLVKRCEQGNSRFLFSLFPDEIRDANSSFWIASLCFLVRLEEKKKAHGFLPSWLGPSTRQGVLISDAIKTLIGHCMTGFEKDPERQAMLLLAFSLRRLALVFSIVSPRVRDAHWMEHILKRFELDEFSWGLIASSPNNSLLLHLEHQELIAPGKCLADWTAKTGHKIGPEIIRQYLRKTWEAELAIINSEPDFSKLMNELSLGEVHPTLLTQLSYDFLGHQALCLLNESPKWKQYTLEHFREEVERQARQNLFMAKKWLGIPVEEVMSIAEDDIKVMSSRFFLGDCKLMQELHEIYRWKEIT